MKGETTGAPVAVVIAAFAAIYVIWGSTYLAIRFAIETMPPLLMAGVRFSVAGTLVYFWRRLAGVSRPTGPQWKAAAVVGAFLLFGGNGAVVWAEQMVDSGLAALIIATVPIWVVVLDWARPGGHRPSRGVIAGVLTGIVGIAVLVGPAEIVGGGRVDLIGAGLLVGAAFSWSAGSLYARGATLPSDSLLVTGMEMLVGGGLLLAAGIIHGELDGIDPTSFSPRSMAALAYLIVFGSIVAFTAYVWLLREVSTTKVATYAYVNPVVALVLGWALAGEAITARSLMAAAIILGAVFLITIHRRSPSPVEPEPEPEPRPGRPKA